MNAQEVIINGKDVEKDFGLVFGVDLSDALLAPAAAKDLIKSKSRLEDGVRTIIPKEGLRLSDRDLILEIGIKAPTRSIFLQRYNSLLEFLRSGWLELQTTHIPDTIFRLHYVSCQQFTNYNSRIAKFILKLNEPNPANRGLENIYDKE